MKEQLYKVEWWDITNFSNEKIKKPYHNLMTKSYTIGKVLKDKDTILVINAGNDCEELCGDAIPKGCIISIKKIKK